MPRAILITRPEPEASHMARLCEEKGFRPIISAVMQVALVPHITLPAHDSIIVTSPHGITEYCIPSLPEGTVCHVVGDRAAQKIQSLGFRLGHAADTGSELYALLAAHLSAPHRLLYLSGEHISFDMAAALARHGVECTRVVTYRMVPSGTLTPPALEALASAEPPAVFFGSKRALQLFTGLAPSPLNATMALCLSPAIAAAAKAAGFQHCLSVEKPRISQLLDTYRSIVV